MRRRRKACILIKHYCRDVQTSHKGPRGRTPDPSHWINWRDLRADRSNCECSITPLLSFLSHRRSWETLSHRCWFDTSFISPLIRCIYPCLSPPLTRNWILLPAFIIGIFLIGLYYNLFTAFASFKFPFGSLAFLSISCIGTPVYDEGSSVLKTAIPKKEKEVMMSRPELFFLLSFLFLFNRVYINLFLSRSAYRQSKHTLLHSGGSVWLQ